MNFPHPRACSSVLAYAVVGLVLSPTVDAALSSKEEKFVARFVDAIYLAEGGVRTRYPYGVKSQRTHSVAHARSVAEISVRRALIRHHGHSGHDFVECFAEKWCPPSADPVGNRNLKRNLRKMMK